MAQIPQKSNSLDDVIPQPEPENELDVRSVRITEPEGIIQNCVTTSVNYQIRENDRFVIADTAVTLTLPIVNKGKIITIKSTVVGTVTVDGGTIDGVSGTTLTTQYEFINLVYNGSEWSTI